ncbi:sodium-coupled neutral amino acid transporter 9-like isoform X1 [Polistes fuscatus]|uniref:sodium-coupled neutral amino acid transporter 9-like isoform X1 n=1 Tax=Polistes fuscatus TaxID=30207 RepID=UPI001CA83E3D|nr:sodium-coupled neutral amino acid transporter 9-like isoform X1 [Polistes fuscatus]XP_043486527.1 sodium-coupled neutral amino acid transporter 9-like isoform X1 [Polistes fuscatus]
MYMPTDHWKGRNTHHDSGSESTPLLSSDSHGSHGSVIFQNSETSDFEYKYGTIEAGSLNSTATVLPRRLPPLLQDNTSTLTNICQSLTFIEEKHYGVHNYDLTRNEKYEESNEQPLTKEYIKEYLSTDLTIRQEDTEILNKDIKPKQSSLVTIFSIWNTILGSSLLTMPWGIQMAGFFPGIILILAMGGLCLYTAHRLIVVHKYHGSQEKVEVVQLSRIFLNKWVEYIARIFSISVLFGATIAYWILMSNFLYNSINFFYDNVMGLPTYSIIDNNTNSVEVLCTRKEMYNGSDIITVQERTFDALGPSWDLHKTVPAFLAIIIFPLLNFNSTTFFTKFNSLGTVSIVYIIIFVLIKSASWGLHMDRSMWESSWVLKSTFPALSGMLALSFFIHNIIITIMQSNRDQSKNGRDLTIAYGLVTTTYIIVGVIFFVCFPLAKSCIQDNLLNNFQKWDPLTVIARIVLLFQLFTVYPLLTYMLRIQLISSICEKSTIYTTLITNFILVLISILFATFLPYIGTVIRYTGALSGLIYVFTLPSLLHLSVLRKQRKLTTVTTIIHLIIPIIGIMNLIAQFFIIDH